MQCMKDTMLNIRHLAFAVQLLSAGGGADFASNCRQIGLKSAEKMVKGINNGICEAEGVRHVAKKQ